MLLRYLEEIELHKATKTKQPNGTFIDSYELVQKYKVTPQTLESDIDAQIYGADINNMLRIQSPYNALEKFLLTKLNNTNDNVSKYFIKYNGIYHRIKAVNSFKVDIERL